MNVYFLEKVRVNITFVNKKFLKAVTLYLT